MCNGNETLHIKLKSSIFINLVFESAALNVMVTVTVNRKYIQPASFTSDFGETLLKVWVFELV